MSKISATIVADSICNGHRITTMKVVMPRMILAEAKTHRVMKRTDEGLEVYDIPGIGFNDDEMLSRNSASSRAIPFKKMIEAVQNDPFIPIAWQKDHSGMQGTEYFTDPAEIQQRKEIWLYARDKAAREASRLYEAGVTKQLCNRLLEPFMWHTVLVTATEFENFFHLRCPQYVTVDGEMYRSRKDFLVRYPNGSWRTDIQWLECNKGQAEIHMMALAEAMWDARNESTPKVLQPGEWHIPYGDQLDEGELHKVVFDNHIGESYEPFSPNYKIKVAVARAARTSYTVVGEEGKPADYKKDIELHDRLLASGHMSPFEHCAQAMTEDELFRYAKSVPYENPIQRGTSQHEYGWCHNLRGWKSYRSMIPNENRR